MKCQFCPKEITDPTGRGFFERVTGWQTKGAAESRKGGSDIVLREGTGEFACGECILKMKQKVNAAQAALDIEERTEPLCRDCFAEVTWIDLPRNGSRMCVDRKPLGISEPRKGFVLVDPSGRKGVVLKQSDIAGARERIAQGARLYRAHRISCSSAQRSAA